MEYVPKYKSRSYIDALVKKVGFYETEDGFGYEIRLNQWWNKGKLQWNGQRIHIAMSDTSFNIHEDNRRHKVRKHSRVVEKCYLALKKIEANLP